jgi:type III secretion system FlhB-like substrate exporter
MRVICQVGNEKRNHNEQDHKDNRKYSTTGKEIPSNLYRAVAEILAFVYRARGVNPGQL